MRGHAGGQDHRPAQSPDVLEQRQVGDLARRNLEQGLAQLDQHRHVGDVEAG
jgi:hypothetical protein